MGRDARLQPSRSGRQKRDERAEQQGGQCGYGCGHSADIVLAYVEPGDPGAEEAQAEGEARARGGRRRRGYPIVHEHGERHDLERIEAERCECRHARRAGDETGDQIHRASLGALRG